MGDGGFGVAIGGGGGDGGSGGEAGSGAPGGTGVAGSGADGGAGGTNTANINLGITNEPTATVTVNPDQSADVTQNVNANMAGTVDTTSKVSSGGDAVLGSLPSQEGSVYMQVQPVNAYTYINQGVKLGDFAATINQNANGGAGGNGGNGNGGSGGKGGSANGGAAGDGAPVTATGGAGGDGTFSIDATLNIDKSNTYTTDTTLNNILGDNNIGLGLVAIPQLAQGP
ncbi:hypothetical protein N2152v2_006898 [Parachlorella kessleri]